MNVNLEQIHAGLIKYIDTEVAPKATGFTKFMVYFFTPSLSNIINSRLEALKASGMVDDLFTENGLIKLDEAYHRAKQAIEKSGKVLIPQVNYFIDSSDVDRLYQLIKGT